MEQFICGECKREFNNYQTLRKHNSMVHKIKSEDTYVLFKCGGIRPTCECGCGNYTKFLGDVLGFRKFVNGHNSATSANNFHKNPESKIKSAKTQSENWNKGMYRRWWEEDTEETKNKIEGIKEKLRNDAERGKKISKALTGIPKSEEAKRRNSETNIQRYKDNPELKLIQSERRLNWMRNNSKVKTSKLEDIFEHALIFLGLIKDVDYERNYLVSNIKTFFDFYLIKQNIIIEVDGDFFHCNPNTDYSEPKYEIQYKNISNDKRKNNWAKNHNIALYRFWEKDINERPEWILEQLKEILNLHD